MKGLTRPTVAQISAPGAADETEIVVNGEKLEVRERTESVISEIQSGNYDPVLGILTLTFYNGESVRIGGFPVASKIPQGPTGPQGAPGIDGLPGKPGKAGAVGAPGCEGPPGPTGGKGNTGKEGRVGPMGPPGPRGNTGPRGEVGEQGPEGEKGVVGPTGPRGEQGPAGAAGTPGAAGAANIIVSTVDPGAAAGAGAIWVNPGVATGTTPPPTNISDPPLGSPEAAWP